MINAGVVFKAFNGTQAYDDATGEWRHVAITINYPEDQNPTSNPPEVGDLIISTTGLIWQVKLVHPDEQLDNEFSVNIEVVNETPTVNIEPALGLLSRGAILTPVKGVVVPYWSSTLVAAEVARIASMYSATVNERDNTSDLEKPISTATQAALDTKLETITVVCNGWSTSNFIVPDGMTVTKEYDGSSLRISHNKGQLPRGWFALSTEGTPMVAITPSSTRNLQVVDTNDVIVTSISSFETFEVSLHF